ncbi:MAG: DUF1786 family protein [Deltaproteobacteria bacterium]|jgi:uncharacterized protein (DUF1786 family)|nr:DUF1786 family protein [Deltaproteobacteria bacterium]
MWNSWKQILREHRDGAPPALFAGKPAALALLRDPAIAERGFRRGMVLLDAGETDITAFLVWRGLVFGIWRQRAAQTSRESLERDLPEFRLGWLPDETALASGGRATAFAALPPEAEGFPAIYITGRDRRRFTGCGRLVDAPAEE